MSKKVTSKWNCGNFTLEHSAEVPEEMVDALLSVGLLHVVQRDVRIDRILGVMQMDSDGKWKPTLGPDKKRLRRAEVDFDEVKATAFTSSLTEYEVGEKKLAVATVASEYTRTEADSKFVFETKLLTKHESADDLEEWLAQDFIVDPATKIRYDAPAYAGPTHGEDGEFAIDALRNARAKVRVIDAARAESKAAL
jgi:hypothetical protein